MSFVTITNHQLSACAAYFSNIKCSHNQVHWTHTLENQIESLVLINITENASLIKRFVIL